MSTTQTITTETGLPPGWEVRHSKSRNLPYYFNSAIQESRWEPPSDADTEKLKAYMASNHTSNTMNYAATNKDNVDRIEASHLLVKHAESRRPSSWKEEKIERTKEDAIKELEKYQAQINNNEKTLAELATTESDCASARKHGQLGWFGRGQMQKEFEDAAFALQPGQMSGIVETASGVHLILRTQ